ncbi:hypothetical protein MTR_1g060880 [Medicago truncatula]|uniref:Uncharacterized protein n=1 Tax=Medicago truncatula TaxID=3880 RepID=A0A072VKX4_MEDTR|nr:hypothetical protein MTR_1g060880 [Medicago truncatula]
MGQWAGPKPGGPARPGPTFVWPKWAWAEKARAHFLYKMMEGEGLLSLTCLPKNWGTQNDGAG